MPKCERCHQEAPYLLPFHAKEDWFIYTLNVCPTCLESLQHQNFECDGTLCPLCQTPMCGICGETGHTSEMCAEIGPSMFEEQVMKLYELFEDAPPKVPHDVQVQYLVGKFAELMQSIICAEFTEIVKHRPEEFKVFSDFKKQNMKGD